MPELIPRELSAAERAIAVAQARAVFNTLWGGEVDPKHACLYFACALQVVVAREFGLHFMLQAGTCQWPMVSPEIDDGVSPSHFSYRWDAVEAMPYILRGELPELHCWLAYRSTANPDGVIVDITSGSWPERARAAGLSWRARRTPPDFLWAGDEELRVLSDEFGFRVNYEPSLRACAVADSFARHGVYKPLVTALL